MGSNHAQTYSGKTGNEIATAPSLLQAKSAASLDLGKYSVPSTDGRLLPAVPVHLALKFKPPTIAVVYTMQDPKSGRVKKYIHEIPIAFSPAASVDSVCDAICAKETTYLNPAFIQRQQVTALLAKLHAQHLAEQETKAPAAQSEEDRGPARKPNFFDRKRFVNYEENQADSEKSGEPAEVVEESVAVVSKKQAPKGMARSGAPPEKVAEQEPVETFVLPAKPAP